MTDLREDADAQVARVGGAEEHGPTGLGHESRDVRIRPIVLAFAALFVVAIAVHVLMYAVLRGFTLRQQDASQPRSPLAASYGRHAPPEPRLQVAPRDDLRRLRAGEDALLHGYAWADRRAGVVRIPIERAIEVLAARGLPAAAVAAAPGPPSAAALAPRPTAAAPDAPARTDAARTSAGSPPR